MRSLLCALTVSLALPSSTTLAASFFDNFNRADSTNLGAGWTEDFGNWRIASNQARSDPNALPTLMTVNGASSTAPFVAVDVIYSGAPRTTYGALVSGYRNDTQNVFVKVQDNFSSGNFNRVYFYFGNNGDPWAGMTGGAAIVDLATPFTAARIWTALVGNTVTLSIDRNFDGVAEDTISRGGLPVATLGTGAGLGGYQDSTFDNFEFRDVPEPATFASAISFASVMVMTRRRRSSHAACGTLSALNLPLLPGRLTFQHA